MGKGSTGVRGSWAQMPPATGQQSFQCAKPLFAVVKKGASPAPTYGVQGRLLCAVLCPGHLECLLLNLSVLLKGLSTLGASSLASWSSPDTRPFQAASDSP